MLARRMNTLTAIEQNMDAIDYTPDIKYLNPFKTSKFPHTIFDLSTKEKFETSSNKTHGTSTLNISQS